MGVMPYKSQSTIVLYVLLLIGSLRSTGLPGLNSTRHKGSSPKITVATCVRPSEKSVRDSMLNLYQSSSPYIRKEVVRHI